MICPCSLLSLQFVVLFLPINFCLQGLPQDIPVNPDKFHRLSVPILNLHDFTCQSNLPQVFICFYHLQIFTVHHMSFSRGFARRFAPISIPRQTVSWRCRRHWTSARRKASRQRRLRLRPGGLEWNNWNSILPLIIIYYPARIWKLLWNILWNIWNIWLYMIVYVTVYDCIWLYMYEFQPLGEYMRIYSCLQSQLWCASLKRPQRLPPCNTPVIMAMLVVFGQSFWSGLKTGYQTQKLATIWINGCMGVEWVESDIK